MTGRAKRVKRRGRSPCSPTRLYLNGSDKHEQLKATRFQEEEGEEDKCEVGGRQKADQKKTECIVCEWAVMQLIKHQACLRPANHGNAAVQRREIRGQLRGETSEKGFQFGDLTWGDRRPIRGRHGTGPGCGWTSGMWLMATCWGEAVFNSENLLLTWIF